MLVEHPGRDVLQAVVDLEGRGPKNKDLGFGPQPTPLYNDGV